MELVSEKLLKLDVNLKDKKEVINFITELLYSDNRINDKKQLIEDVYKREEEASTSMGMGISIPHAKSSAVLESSVVFLRLKDEIEWNEDKNIKLVFGIFVPVENIDNQHLKILASLARKLASESFRQELLFVKNENEGINLLNELNKEKNVENK